MMLQGSSGNSGDGVDNITPATVATGGAEIGSSGFSEDEKGRVDDGGRNSAGNRWPRQETLALLKIRSDMDVVFRDSSLKGPLWDEVSRKLAELGYHRSAKKCKEKFENVYKYHKRTKDGRTSKADGKTYRFFDQLQALEGSPSNQQPLSLTTPVVTKASPMTNIHIPSIVTPIGMTVSNPNPNNVDPISVAAPAVAMPTMNISNMGGFSFSQLNMSGSSSYSSSSDEDETPDRRTGRKRKWKEFFGRLMKEVVDKQEEMQSKFLDTLERRERERMAREEAWRLQEMAKMKREHELLVQERSMVAAKDAAVISFLQKITEQNPNVVIPQISAMQLLQQQQNLRPTPPVSVPATTSPTPTTMSPPPPSMQQLSQQQQSQQQESVPVPRIDTNSTALLPIPIPASTPILSAVKNLDNGAGGGESMLQPSPSRWPKAEINALIHLRTTLDTKYQENGPKGPLWEEISSAMRKIGYNRNAKRCKEKWENINKYYKKVKESSKKRPEDSKTCPYFHQLDAIYREKASNSNSNTNSNLGFGVKPETQMAPIMARPEQQWPLPAVIQQQPPPPTPQQQQLQPQPQPEPNVTEPKGGIHEQQQNTDQNDDDDYDDDEDDEEEEEEEGGEYEIVPNKTSSMAAVE